MRKNFVREKLKNGQPSVGTWLSLSSTLTAGLMARTGFDWLTTDFEHSPVSLETAAANFAIIAASGKVPLARVSWNTAENIKRALDSGAHGVIVPMVNSRAEAEAAVAATRYAPEGQRSIGGNLHAASFATDTSTYYANANREILLVVMLEHIRAVENAEEILSVPGIDAFFIGPNDLHNSLGQPPAFESDAPEFVQALDHLLKTGKKKGVPAGIHVADAEAAQRRIAEGFQFIAVASDAGMLLAKAGEITKKLGLAGGTQTAKY